MKYIKIKEPYENTIKIMEVHHEEQDCYVCEYKYSDILLSASKDWVIAKADTIEELCDEFVIADLLGNEKPILIIKSVVREMMRRTTNTQIYGAIWVEIKLPNGKSVFRLEPVATLNDEGKLCLI